MDVSESGRAEDSVNPAYTDDTVSKVDTSKVDTSKVDTSQAKPKKLTREELHQEIIHVCSEDFKTLEEVSQVLGKSVSYLKNKVFPVMIDLGLLERLHPNINHPHQAYKAKI